MPLSSKVIIDYLATLEKPRSTSQVIHHFISTKKEKRENRKGKKRPYNPQKDIEAIHRTIEACLTHALIEKKGKGFISPGSFIVHGTFHLNSSGDGLVRAEDHGDILIPSKNRGRAVQGDSVTIKVTDLKKGYFHGRVIDITRTGNGLLTVKLYQEDSSYYYLTGVDFPSDVIYAAPKSGQNINQGQMAFVSLSGETVRQHPVCTIEATFTSTDESMDFQRIKVRHDLPGEHQEPEGLPALDQVVQHDGPREDFRDIFTVTIDGEYAKDFDDAISLEQNAQGYKLWVHIADVSSYIAPGSPADQEAARRGTSFYIGNNVIPMFHEIISNNLCSLRQDEDRPALSAVIHLDRQGEVTDYHFTRSLINVDKRLTYRSSDSMLSDKTHELYPFLTLCWELASLLKKKRLTNGRLDLELTDVELSYDGNNIHDLVASQRLRSHVIIEEFMLSANVQAAVLLRDSGMPTLYRVHEPVSDESMTAMKQFIKLFHLKPPKTSSPSRFIQEVLHAVRGRDDSEVVNYIVLRSLMQAFYGIEPLGHFGLGFSDYTHFTSPIRRYPDLIVHRCIKSLLDDKEPPYSSVALVALGETSSSQERLAMKAERDMIKLKSCRLMSNRIHETFEAVISGISKNGFYVTLREKPIEGMVPLRYLTDDYYLVKEDEYTIVGKRLNRRFRLGDIITVRLETADIELFRLDFSVV